MVNVEGCCNWRCIVRPVSVDGIMLCIRSRVSSVEYMMWKQIVAGIIVGGVVLALLAVCAIAAEAAASDFIAGFMAGLRGY